MPSHKKIWLPKSTLNVTVEGGKVYISEAMVMEEKHLQAAQGFQPPKPEQGGAK